MRSQKPNDKIYVNEAYLGEGSAVTTFKKNKNYTIRVEEKGCQSVTVPATKSYGAGTGAWQQFDQTSYVITSQCPSK
ncbi:MAG: PEGA domain-containing protein [Enterococcus faecalis]